MANGTMTREEYAVAMALYACPFHEETLPYARGVVERFHDKVMGEEGMSGDDAVKRMIDLDAE